MYKFELPPETLKNLWRLREYCAQGPIARQVREAVQTYIKEQEKKIGCPLADFQEALDRREKEKLDLEFKNLAASRGETN